MSIFNHFTARIWLLGLMLMVSPGLFALGLGNAKVESFLNQPLDARIELLSRPGDDLTLITAGLASAEDFALIGANRAAISVPLRFSIETGSDQAFVRVTSNLPVSDPVIRVIIELNWENGRLLREYTLFLDPPVVDAVAPPPVIDERRQPSPASVRQPEASVSPDQDVAESNDTSAITDEGTSGQAAAQRGSLTANGDEYGPVQSGETLWSIASNLASGSGGSVNQVMLAIQRNNPQAFINNNINLLRRGAILRMPDMADIDAISAAEARNEVLEQSQSFRTADNTSAQPTAPSPEAAAPAVETPLVDVASEMTSQSQDTSTADETPTLEIVPPSADDNADSAYGAENSNEAGSASTSVDILQEELARKEEELITEQQTNQYLQERINELESKLLTNDSALAVEDAELSEMESRLRANREAEATSAAKEVPKVGTAPASDVAPWYENIWLWIVAVLVLAVAAFGWLRSRSGQVYDLAASVDKEAAVRGLKDEAEEILKVLKPEEDDEEASPKSPQEEAQADVLTPRFGHAKRIDPDEASVLDEDSADPEVRLDLARAYISMGDREAARAILGEVIEHGSDEQKTEAQTMLDEL